MGPILKKALKGNTSRPTVTQKASIYWNRVAGSSAICTFATSKETCIGYPFPAGWTGGAPAGVRTQDPCASKKRSATALSCTTTILLHNKIDGCTKAILLWKREKYAFAQ